MQARPHSYLFSISYFGARYKGWAVQPEQPTIQGKLEKVLKFVLGHADFAVLAASRTDAGVSALGGYVQVFLREKTDLNELLPVLNQYLPQDIRLNAVEEVSVNFNLIQAVSHKTYRYFFSNSVSFHPFAAAFLVNVSEKLDFEKMNQALNILIGKHDFKGFCTPSPTKTDFKRAILATRICPSSEFLGMYFPQEIYYMELTGKGFLHHQVRIIMSAIWKVGKGDMQLDELANRLISPDDFPKIPPASPNGLVLWETILNKTKPID